MIKTAKFGGSSLSDATQFQKVAAIVRADSDRRFVVVSAPGSKGTWVSNRPISARPWTRSRRPSAPAAPPATSWPAGASTCAPGS